jgi:mannose-6-phosphate isomerase-like protein (cupin superfamily)
MTEVSPTTPKSPVILRAGDIEALETETFSQEQNASVSWKTLVSSPKTSTESLTVGIATCPPNGGSLPRHRHAQAECYHIISGNGSVIIDGKEHAVGAGSVIYIPGHAEHSVRNEHPVEELKWFYVFNANSFADIKYIFDS